jgi:hypothetical protein
MKRCEYCGKEMVRPRWGNGELDSTWEKRRFCSSRCYGDLVISQGRANRKSGRKRAQRTIPMTECARCRGTTRLQRHHKDRNPLNNARNNVEILCQTCHKTDHLEDGTWGISGFKNRLFREWQLGLKSGSIDLDA